MPLKEHITFYSRLKKELELWLQEGVITSEQRDKIILRYATVREADEKAGPGKLVTTISVLGSILVGVGFILFIASNWSEIPRWGKLFIIFSSMLVSYVVGFYMRYEKGNYPKVGAALVLLGSIIFGAGILLIAQIYHITVHYPNGPLMWGLGLLPLAYMLGLRSLLFLALMDFLIWLGMESWLRIPGYEKTIAFITLYLMAGVALWTTGLMHSGFRSLKKMAAPYLWTGVPVSFFCAYILTFDVFKAGLGAEELGPFYAGIMVLFAAALIIYLQSSGKEKHWMSETASLFAMMLFVLLLALFFHGGYGSAGPDKTFNIMTFTSNIIFAFAVIGILVLGYMRRLNAYINIGLLFFVLDVIARYFDYFWKLLPRSLFFIIGGGLLLSGGLFLERKRRKILSSFADREVEE